MNSMEQRGDQIYDKVGNTLEDKSFDHSGNAPKQASTVQNKPYPQI